MMSPNIIVTIKELLNERLKEIESVFDADVFVYSGQIVDGNEHFIMQMIEDLAADEEKKDRLVVLLTTGGGSATAVERYVNIMRHHYATVDFVVPNYAYSAGTIFCMSGDNIYMDYSSVLGPIDPQVLNKDGRWVAALGYLDKVNELIAKSNAGTLSEAEFTMLEDLDLAELRSYEQARDLTIDLLKDWLVNYKFKNWSIHQTNENKRGQEVTRNDKEERAKEIANKLSDNNHWKSHSRAINITALRNLRLKIEDYSAMQDIRTAIRTYHDLLMDYILTNKIPIFVHSRKYI